MRDFRELRVWAKAHQLVLSVYAETTRFPADERFGLTSQLRRAASSVAANIAEGCGRSGDAELARFCLIAFGSANELEYHLLLARDLGYVEQDIYVRLNDATIEVKKMLSSFINSLRAGA